MWKKIVFFQLALLVALLAFWAGKETRAAEEPLSRQFVTFNEEGNILYLWIYDAGNKHWNAQRLSYDQASLNEIEIKLQ